MQKYMRIVVLIMTVLAFVLSAYFKNFQLKSAIYLLVIIPYAYYSILKKRGMNLKYFIIDLSFVIIFTSPFILNILYERGVISFNVPFQYSIGAVVIFTFVFLAYLFIKKYFSCYF